MELISMTDFVLEQKTKIPTENVVDLDRVFIQRVIDYATFLKRPLHLGMFVPCDENGNVLEEPKEMANAIIDGDNSKEWAKNTIDFEEAKERVLFEGFKLKQRSQLEYRWGTIMLLHFSKSIDFNFKDDTKESNEFTSVKTIEDLCIAHDLKLTQSAINQIK